VQPPIPRQQERWLGDKDPSYVEGCSDADGLNRAKRFTPFGAGTKSCVGQALAIVQVRTLLVKLLSQFWVELAPCMGPAENVEDQLKASLTFIFTKGLHMHFREHAAAVRTSTTESTSSGSAPSSPVAPEAAAAAAAAEEAPAAAAAASFAQ